MQKYHLKAHQIIISALLLIFVAAGCTPQQRLTRLLSKNPELIETKTVVFDTNIVVRNHTLDTTFQMQHTDTKTFEDSALIVTIERQGDTFSLNVERKQDTISIRQTHDYTIVNKETQQVIKKQITWKAIRGYVFIAAIVVFLFLLFRKKG